MAVLHPDDIGFFHQFLKGRYRNREFVIVGIVIDDDV